MDPLDIGPIRMTLRGLLYGPLYDSPHWSPYMKLTGSLHLSLYWPWDVEWNR